MAQIKKRKQETRLKIELGGMLVKATLAHYPNNGILGALIDAMKLMVQDPAKEKVFARKGRKAFLEDEQKERTMGKTMDIEVTEDVLRELKEEMAEAKHKAE